MGLKRFVIIIDNLTFNVGYVCNSGPTSISGTAISKDIAVNSRVTDIGEWRIGSDIG